MATPPGVVVVGLMVTVLAFTAVGGSNVTVPVPGGVLVLVPVGNAVGGSNVTVPVPGGVLVLVPMLVVTPFGTRASRGIAEPIMQKG